MLRAYAILDTKRADGRPRRIAGIATTPTPDRSGDVLDPLGATFRNPIPLLYHHDRERPIGTVTLHAPTAAGIAFDATIPDVDTPGPLRDRVDDAWQTLTAGLITGVSIGYRVLDGGMRILKSGARHFSRVEICELSLVTIPANMDATIHTIKSLDALYLPAAPGDRLSGVPVSALKRPNMTTQERISQFENSRAAKVARMAAIMGDATDATLPDDTREEYDGLALEVKSIDDHLVRARELERLLPASAARVESGTPALRTPAPVVSVKSNAPPGLTFVRAVKARLQANGDSYRAMEYARQYHDPNVELLIKAAVTPGNTTDPAWAAALVTVSNLTNEFIELSRAATILGRVPGIRKVPFNTSVPIVTAGGTYKWVGQGKAKPVGKMQFGSASLGMSKAAGIIVLTEELVRSSQPSAELIVRDEMIKGIAAFLDQQFTDPAVAAVADTNPASITNGAPTAASLDDPAKDLGIIITYFTTNNVPLENVAILMSQSNAYAMGFGRNGLGTPNFPGVGPKGGSANGITIVASNTVGDKVIGLAADHILLADDGAVTIDVSREASIQMNDAPVSPADPATTVWSSLWQDNLVGLRAERFINWKKAGATSVYYLTGAVYPVV
jgi:HK97 family phage prohead protease/HK97 family phage major capsid protein